MTDLGRVYEHGIGVRASREKAMEWYRKAAAKGNEDSVEALKRLIPEAGP